MGHHQVNTTGMTHLKINGLYSSPTIILMIKSGRMRWVGHVARMERRELRTELGKPEGKRPLGRP